MAAVTVVVPMNSYSFLVNGDGASQVYLVEIAKTISCFFPCFDSLNMIFHNCPDGRNAQCTEVLNRLFKYQPNPCCIFRAGIFSNAFLLNGSSMNFNIYGAVV